MRTFLLVAVLVGLPMPMQVQAATWDGNDLANNLREYEKAKAVLSGASGFQAGLYSGYVTAASDALEVAQGKVICKSNSVTVGQVNAVVAAYLKANPKKWDEDAILLVYDALKEAFPCG